MKYALIGCGKIAPNHIEAAKNNSLEISAVCDLISSKMDNVVDLCGLGSQVKKYESYLEMLKNERPELVAIATESGRHAHIALDCIRSGCNVIIEKPIALSIKDAEIIAECAKQNKVKVCVNHQNRFNRSIQYIRRALEAGRFGKLLHGAAHIRWNRGLDYYRSAEWRGTWEQDGGAMMNQCIHNIDLLRWMMNSEADEVFSYTDRLMHPYIEAEDLGLALVKFKNGAYGIIEGTTNVFPKNLEETLYLFGEKATVKAGGKSVNSIEEWTFSDSIDDSDSVKMNYSEEPPNIYGYGHTPLYADMIDSIINDREPCITAEEGKKSLELVLAIYKSASCGQPVKLPLEDCSTVDFKGRF